MKSTFQAQLVNSPAGDPGLYVRMRWQGRALLFDLGRVDALDPGALLRVTDVFVSHAHMDHFIGFDHLLRTFLARDARLRLFGPSEMIRKVAGKLQGYIWNLVEGYPLILDVTEVADDGLRSARLRASTGFAVEPLGEQVISTDAPIPIVQEPGLRVETVQLDHKIPCLAFAAHEPTHLNVDTEALARQGAQPGPWLTRLKTAVREERPSDDPVEIAPGHTLTLAEARSRFLIETPGQRLVYVTDAAFSPSNVGRIVRLARDADLLVCEAPFLDADRDRALARAHLTARQAGALARWAGVRNLMLFHFSPRHGSAHDELRREADEEFTGRDAHYGNNPL